MASIPRSEAWSPSFKKTITFAFTLIFSQTYWHNILGVDWIPLELKVTRGKTLETILLFKSSSDRRVTKRRKRHNSVWTQLLPKRKKKKKERVHARTKWQLRIMKRPKSEAERPAVVGFFVRTDELKDDKKSTWYNRGKRDCVCAQLCCIFLYMSKGLSSALFSAVVLTSFLLPSSFHSLLLLRLVLLFANNTERAKHLVLLFFLFWVLLLLSMAMAQVSCHCTNWSFCSSSNSYLITIRNIFSAALQV